METPLTHGFDGSETITSYFLPCAAKKVFASSMWMRLRGSAKARRLAGSKSRAPSTIMRSISMVSTSVTAGLPRSVCVVSRTMVGSSIEAFALGSISIAASTLPLVRMDLLVKLSTTAMVAVLPSR